MKEDFDFIIIYLLDEQEGNQINIVSFTLEYYNKFSMKKKIVRSAIRSNKLSRFGREGK